MRLLVVLLLLVGCSSSMKRMRGDEASLVSEEKVENLRITGERDKLLSLDNYHVVNLYLRNLNTRWLRVKGVEIVDVKGSPGFQVILAEDLVTWAKSMALDIELKEEKSKKDKKIDYSLHRAKLTKLNPKTHVYEPFSLPIGCS